MPGDPDETAARLLREQPNLQSRNCNTRCVELIWRRDEFRLRALNMQFPVVQAEQSLVKYVTDRRQTLNLVSLYRNLEGHLLLDIHPGAREKTMLTICR